MPLRIIYIKCGRIITEETKIKKKRRLEFLIKKEKQLIRRLIKTAEKSNTSGSFKPGYRLNTRNKKPTRNRAAITK